MAQKTVTISNKQNLFDIAVQETGSNENVFEIAMANDLSVSSVLVPGQLVVIPDTISVKKEIVNNYIKQNHKVATAIRQGDFPEDPDGIGYMIIESTFIVS